MSSCLPLADVKASTGPLSVLFYYSIIHVRLGGSHVGRGSVEMRCGRHGRELWF